jgi:hypothetical protein
MQQPKLRCLERGMFVVEVVVLLVQQLLFLLLVVWLSLCHPFTISSFCELKKNIGILSQHCYLAEIKIPATYLVYWDSSSLSTAILC